jgi:hypothetical protein
MAKIHTETVVVTISKLVKDTDEATSSLNGEMLSALTQVVEELVGEGFVVEVEVA